MMTMCNFLLWQHAHTSAYVYMDRKVEPGRNVQSKFYLENPMGAVGTDGNKISKWI
jgi:hypothetical protein